MVKCDLEGFGLCDAGICNYSVLYVDTYNLDPLALVTFGFLHSLTDNWTPSDIPYPAVWTASDNC